MSSDKIDIDGLLNDVVRTAIARRASSEWRALVGRVDDGTIRVALIADSAEKFAIIDLDAAAFLNFELSNGYLFFEMDEDYEVPGEYEDDDDERTAPERLFDLALDAFEAFLDDKFSIKDGWWQPAKYMVFDDVPLRGKRLQRERPLTVVNVVDWVNWRPYDHPWPRVR